MISVKKNNKTSNGSNNGNSDIVLGSQDLWLRKYKIFRRKAFLSIFISISLFVILIGFISSRYSIDSLSKSKINKLKISIQDIDRKSDDLERKTFSSEKFIEISRGLPERQGKTEGMSVREARDLFESLDDKYNIRDLQIQLSTPVELKGEFTRGSVKTMTSEVVLNFNALLDTDVDAFLQEVRSKLTGYVVVTKYSLRRTREINDLYIKEVYRGEWPTSLSGQLVFRWYVLS